MKKKPTKISIIMIVAIVFFFLAGCEFLSHSIDGQYVSYYGNSFHIKNGKYYDNYGKEVSSLQRSGNTFNAGNIEPNGHSSIYSYYKVDDYFININSSLGELQSVSETFDAEYIRILNNAMNNVIDENKVALSFFSNGAFQEKNEEGFIVLEGEYKRDGNYIFFYLNASDKVSYFYCIYDNKIFYDVYKKSSDD